MPSEKIKQTSPEAIYQSVTDKIIQALETGTAQWRKPWKTPEQKPNVCPMALPVNGLTRQRYSGINILLLWLAAQHKGFASTQWVTYKQAKALGCNVIKGEKSTELILYKPYSIPSVDGDHNLIFDEDGQPVLESKAYMTRFNVFNIEQCENLPEHSLSSSDIYQGIDTVPNQMLTEIVNATGVRIVIRHQDKAYYRPIADLIVLPHASQFFSEQAYWSTLLHELVHASGHHCRLNREGISINAGSSSEVYAFEELVAEIGCAFLCAFLGIDGDLQHESYIENWLKILREDKRAIFRACRFAREAFEYLSKPLNINGNQIITS